MSYICIVLQKMKQKKLRKGHWNCATSRYKSMTIFVFKVYMKHNSHTNLQPIVITMCLSHCWCSVTWKRVKTYLDFIVTSVNKYLIPIQSNSGSECFLFPHPNVVCMCVCVCVCLCEHCYAACKICQILFIQDHSHEICPQHRHNTVNFCQHWLCLSLLA